MSGTAERLDFDAMEAVFIRLFGGRKSTPEERATVDAEWDALQDEVFGPAAGRGARTTDAQSGCDQCP